MARHTENNRSQNRRRFLKTTGAALAASVAIPGATAAQSQDTASFDPSDRDAVIEYLEWADKQDNTVELLEGLNEARTKAVGDVMTNVTWTFEEEGVSPTAGTEGGVSILAYQSGDYTGTATASVEGTTTEYIFEHRIDWSYDFGEGYRNVESTLTAKPVGLLAEYVNGSKGVDAEVRNEDYFIQRASADFRLVGVGRQVTSEVDVKGDVYGDGETVKSSAPL